MPADVASSLKNWSTTPGTNLPTGSTAISTNLDDNLREIQAVVRDLAASNTIASASTTDIGAVDETFLSVSGTTTITGLGTVSAGIYKWLTFQGALTLTHNGTSLILPTAANITTTAGDVAMFLSLGSGNWRCMAYLRADGGVVGAVRFADGTVSAPGATFSSDLDNGLYRIGTNNWALSAGGTKVIDLTAATVTIPVSTAMQGFTGTTGSVTSLSAATLTGSASVTTPLVTTSGDLTFTKGAAANRYLFAAENTSDDAIPLSISTAGSGMGFVHVTTGGTLSALYGAYGAFTSAGVQSGESFMLTALGPVVRSAAIDASDAGLWVDTDQAAGTGFDLCRMRTSANGTPDLKWRVRGDGATFADGAYSSSGADYAEAFLYEGEKPEPGDTVALVGEKVKKAEDFEDVIGVVSERPAVIGDQKLLEAGGVPVGLIGKLRVNPGCPVNPRWKLLKDDLYLVV